MEVRDVIKFDDLEYSIVSRHNTKAQRKVHYKCIRNNVLYWIKEYIRVDKDGLPDFEFATTNAVSEIVVKYEEVIVTTSKVIAQKDTYLLMEYIENTLHIPLYKYLQKKILSVVQRVHIKEAIILWLKKAENILHEYDFNLRNILVHIKSDQLIEITLIDFERAPGSNYMNANWNKVLNLISPK